MADYQDVFGYNEWPLAKFYFEVDITGVGTVSFQTVEGLESEITIIEYRDGDSPHLFKSKRYGMVNFGNVTFKKGMFAEDADLMKWWSMFSWQHTGRGDRKTITVKLKDENEKDVMTWSLLGCFPVKFMPTGLDAEADSEIALEEIEVACEAWTLEVNNQ